MLLVSIPLFAAAGCSESASTPNDPAVQVSSPASPSAAPVSTTPSSEASTEPPRETSAAPPSPSGDGGQNDGGAPTGGSCGLVTSASGLRLSVLPTPDLSCPDAVALVKHFHSMLGGRQPAGSGQPVSASVDGWMCVSGPPAAQGGTTCSQGDKTVFATVAAE